MSKHQLEEFYAGVKNGKIDGPKTQDRIFKKIDEVLDGGKIVSMGWDSSDVYSADERGSDHAVTIVARKKIDGVCRYRIRDNFGIECYDMRSDFKGHCDGRNGGIWFARGEIPSIYGLVWIR